MVNLSVRKRGCGIFSLTPHSHREKSIVTRGLSSGNNAFFIGKEKMTFDHNQAILKLCQPNIWFWKLKLPKIASLP